ncbi:alkyl sulfatase C-terminal domain-containing protein [Mycobacterium sp. NAZ190054]|uniref:alkyl sulfatase C-terminal domain-containing protein n=1 Tax=Mycobacterium sp. NAZ190054 TaxID=1747766 RepID=UPI000A9E521F|nr:alkyl sulfatase C-terminal domain-containing protein [Mycobacterium sp. NAZ190054]
MGIQFRLGPNDHKQVEDLLSREHAGTDAIILDTKAARHQAAAATAAVEAGLRVYWEPAAERLAAEGFGLDKLPLCTGRPYGINALAEDQSARRAGRPDGGEAPGARHPRHGPALLRHRRTHCTTERRSRRTHRLAVGKDKPTRAVITVHAQRQVHQPQQGVRPHRRERGAALRSRAGTERQRQPDTAKATLDDIQLGNITLDDPKKQNKLTIDGQEASFNDFLGLLDTFPFWCNIVTP